MKRSCRFPFRNIMPVALFIFILFNACKSTDKHLNIITLKGPAFADNMLIHNALFGSLADSGEVSALLASEGDLLYVLGGEAEFFTYVRYHSELGQHLEFTVDSLLGYTKINDQIYSIYIEYNSGYESIINKLSDEELSNIKFLHISVDSGTYDFSELKRIGEINPHIGLSLEELSGPDFQKILSFFHPTSLIGMEADSYESMGSMVSHLNKLELISLVCDSSGPPDFLYQLPELNTLMIYDWVPERTGPIQFERLEKLESLTLNESEIQSLKAIGPHKSLSSLYLIGCESLADISQLKDLPDICFLGLAGCETLYDLSVLNEIPSLKWLSFPSQVSQENFDEIIALNPFLIGVELLGCNNINDLTSLIQLPELKSLFIDLDDNIDYEALEQLSGIKLIVLAENNFDRDAENIEALKEALPDSHIVPGGGFCMGSGWILLILPVLFLALGYRRFVRK